jgi:hypothetical protein
MKQVLFYLLLFYTILFFGCSNIVNEMTDIKNDITEVEDVKLDKNGFLVFKDQSTYTEISSLVDKMNDQEFLEWEKSLGFQSAQTFRSIVDAQIENMKTKEEYEKLKQEFSYKLIFEDDGSVRLPFYATAWDRVLNVDGIMKIGNKLFKFEKDRELIINNGEIEDLKDINSLLKDKDRVNEFYPLIEINKSALKTLQWGTLYGNTVYSTDRKSRLIYSLQLISFNYKGYGVTNPPVYYTEAGFEFKLNLQQERNGLFGWYNNETLYYFGNTSHHLEYFQPEHWYNYYYNNVFIERRKIGGEHVVEYKTFPYSEWGETRYGCTYTFHYYYFVDQYDWSFVEPQIFNFTCTFNSRGVDKQTTITYSNI